MPPLIARLLDHTAFVVLARIVLTFPFWSSGLAKLIPFSNGVAEMQMFGLEPAWLFNAAVIATQLGGSLLIILNRGAWLGAGALAVFTVLTIPIAHRFWELDGEKAMMEFFFVIEHIGLIGGLMVTAALAPRTADLRPASLRPALEG